VTFLESAVCGADGDAPPHGYFRPASGAKTTLAIEVISDAICPGAGLQAAPGERDRGARAGCHGIRHLASFRAQPRDAKAGVDRRAYRSASSGLGSTPSARRAGRRAGRLEGSCSTMTRWSTPEHVRRPSPNLAAGHKQAGRVVEGLFAPTSRRARRWRPHVLADIGASAGLDRARSGHAASDEGQAEVRSELQRAVNFVCRAFRLCLSMASPLLRHPPDLRKRVAQGGRSCQELRAVRSPVGRFHRGLAQPRVARGRLRLAGLRARLRPDGDARRGIVVQGELIDRWDTWRRAPCRRRTARVRRYSARRR